MKQASTHQQQFRMLFDTCIEEIRRHAYYLLQDEPTANDIVQEAFLTIWEKREKVEWSGAKGLLYTIVNNAAKNHFKHQAVKRKHQDSQGMKIEYETPEHQIRQEEFRQKLEDCISQLPEGSRVAFLMNRIDALKYKEIAEQLAISIKAVEKRMSIAIQLLTGCIGQKL